MTEQVEFAHLPRQEIFASGTWNGLPFNDTDLDGIADTFNALQLAGKIPLKLGHRGPDVRDDPRTQFAMGWVNKVWREGRKLYADFEVPDKVKEFIDNKYLKFKSIELLKNVKVASREIPWLLDAVALLGTEQPAVGILGSLQAFESDRKASSFSSGERLAFARDTFIPFNSSGDQRHMSDDNKTQELLDRLQAMQTQILELQNREGQTKSQLAEFSTLKRQYNELQGSVAERDCAQRRAELRAVFDRAIENEDIVPAVRERFDRINRIDDNDTVMLVTVEMAQDYVRENPSPLPKRKQKKTVSFSLDRPDGEVPAGTLPDTEVSLRVKALLASRNIHEPTWEQILSASKEVFSVNPSLGKRYQLMPDEMSRAS